MQFYDLAQKKITRTIPWPRGEEREFVNIRFSPDGKLLYFFGDDVLILETDELHRGRHLAAEPADRAGPGPRQLRIGRRLQRDPGFFTGLFTTQDPIQNRRIMIIGRVNLVGQDDRLHPDRPGRRRRLRAWRPIASAPTACIAGTIGRYEFWAFDVAQKKLLNRTPFEGRPRMALRVVVQRQAALRLPGRRDHRRLRRRDYKYLRTIEMNARSRRRAVHPAAVTHHGTCRHASTAARRPR